jgi:hypothetical protein
MSARLVSRKPRPYASFVAVSISRVRLSGCAVRIFSDSEELVIYLTQTIHPMRPCCQPPRQHPRDTPILGAGGWWTNPKGVGSNGSYLVSWQTAYQVAVERDHGRLTAYPEVESVTHCCVCNFRIAEIHHSLSPKTLLPRQLQSPYQSTSKT